MEGEGWRAVGIERTMGIEKAGFCGLFGSTERSVFPAWGSEEEEKGEERRGLHRGAGEGKTRCRWKTVGEVRDCDQGNKENLPEEH